MGFNKEVAIELLKLIDDLSSPVLLRPSNKVESYKLPNLIPKSLEDQPLETILKQLYTLSASGFIHPPISLDQACALLEENAPTSDFLFLVLPEIVRGRTLTVQGYEYLQGQTQPELPANNA